MTTYRIELADGLHTEIDADRVEVVAGALDHVAGRRAAARARRAPLGCGVPGR